MTRIWLVGVLLVMACGSPAATPAAPATQPATTDTGAPRFIETAANATGVCEHHTVPKAELDELLADSNGVSRMARLVPVPREGGTVMQLAAVRADGTLARWGFRNGDALIAANGIALTSAESALEIYQSFRNQTRFDVDIERAGAPMRLCFDIVAP